MALLSQTFWEAESALSLRESGAIEDCTQVAAGQRVVNNRLMRPGCLVAVRLLQACCSFPKKLQNETADLR